MRRFGVVLSALWAAVGAFHSSAHAQSSDYRPTTSDVESLRQQGASVRAITPIYSQLLVLSFPAGFKPAFENTVNGFYINEAVLAGETVQKWTQMVTVTGNKGLALKADLTPQIYAGAMAEGFRKNCPASFAAFGYGAVKLGSHDGYVAVISCGTAVSTGAPYSESLLLVAIKGDSEYYTIQWAERGPASATALPRDDGKWMGRLNQVMPIRLCPIVPGEAAPYPSCADRKP